MGTNLVIGGLGIVPPVDALLRIEVVEGRAILLVLVALLIGDVDGLFSLLAPAPEIGVLLQVGNS